MRESLLIHNPGLRIKLDVIQTIIQSVAFIGLEGLVELPPSDVSPSKVGDKAFGLATLPPEWTLPFCVVDGSLSSHANGSHDFTTLKSSLYSLGWYRDWQGSIIVRSSAVGET